MRSKVELAFVILFSAALMDAAATGKGASTSAATYSVALTGNAKVGKVRAAGLGGDLDGTGLVELTVDPGSNQICYDFTLSDLATPLMAHIHKAPESSDGPSVVTLFTGPGADLDGCVPWTEKWLTKIVSRPKDFYVNLATTEYPDGAIRGQLSG